MYTANAAGDELDAMVQTPVDHAERDVLQKELKLMTKLLEKLTYPEARRCSYLHSRSRQANNMNVPASGARQTSSYPPAPSV